MATFSGENPFWANSYNKNEHKDVRIGNWVEERALRQDSDPDLKYELKSWADSAKRFARGNEKPDAHSSKILTGTYAAVVPYDTTNRVFHNGADPKEGLPPAKGRREQLLEAQMLKEASQRPAPAPPAGNDVSEYADTIGRTGAGRLAATGGKDDPMDGTVMPRALDEDWTKAALYHETPVTVYTKTLKKETFGRKDYFSCPIQNYTKGPHKLE